jgi:hypothetical protein
VLRNQPPNNVAAEDVDDDVEIEHSTSHSPEECDVPRPDLVWASGDQARSRIALLRRVTRPPLPAFTMSIEHAIEGAPVAVVHAFFKQRGVDLPGSRVSEALTV